MEIIFFNVTIIRLNALRNTSANELMNIITKVTAYEAYYRKHLQFTGIRTTTLRASLVRIYIRRVISRLTHPIYTMLLKGSEQDAKINEVVLSG